MKITLLGAGSAFTQPLMTDIMLIEGIEPGELCLVDIDSRRLGVTYELVKNIAAALDRRWKVTASTERRTVMKGSDFIINSIEVSGTAAVRYDNDIPLKYGVDQCIGDTIGPGGIFKALRTLPSWIEILKDVDRLCPNALVMNYTNPMSIMTLAALRTTRASVVGLCHSVQGTSKQLAHDAGVPYEEMVWECGGINHLAWFTKLEHKGRDLYPKLFQVAKRSKKIYEQNPVRYDMMQHFGAYVTESSGHFSEYLPYYRKRPDLIKKYCRGGYVGQSGFYADNWPKWRQDSDRKRLELSRQIAKGKLPEFKRGHEYAADIVEGRMLDRKKTIYASVANTNLIPNLCADNVVEVKVLVDRNGYNPCYFGKLPPQMAAICRSHQAVYECCVEGILKRDREMIYHAMTLDPLTAAVLCPAEVRKMTDEMARAERKLIPPFMHKK